MKKIIIAIIFLSILNFSSLVYAESFTIAQLTDNEYRNMYPTVNFAGEVAWLEARPNDNIYNIFLYEDNTVKSITNDSLSGAYKANPDISDNGRIVWQGQTTSGDSYAFLYDGTSISTLSNTRTFHNPQISDNGSFIVWPEDVVSMPHNYDNIYLYNGTNTTQMPNSEKYQNQGPQVNSLGQVVWQAETNGIYFYDGSNRTKIFGPVEWGANPQVNDSGQIVWDDNDNMVRFYDGATTSVIGYTGSFSPMIDNNGYVVWANDHWADNGIWLFDGSISTRIATSGINPQIYGDNIVWQAFDGTDWELFFYDGSSTMQLTDNNYDDIGAKIRGDYITWRGRSNGEWQIFLASPESNVIPEPSSLLLLSLGGLLLRRRLR